MIKKNEKKINDNLLLFKIIIIGCSNVGKTEILNSFITNRIFKNNTKPTVGISFVSAKDIIDNNLVRFQIWDTAGEERYRSVIINYFKKAKGALIVYDITNEESFEQLDYWYNELKNQTDAEIIIVGNKLDLSNERKIDSEKIKLNHIMPLFLMYLIKIKKILMKFLKLYLKKYLKIIKMKITMA